jgi:NAD(P)-dependent dehydrogenase (short-subunit alcohol dehydrogenase family)
MPISGKTKSPDKNPEASMKSILVAIVLLAAPFSIISDALARQDSNPQKAVLITGASTGIGRNMAETLAAEGYFVYAGARKQADIDALSAIDNIQGIRLDVTMVRKEGRGLYGLVNNAGVGVLGPMIEIDEDDMQFQMDVNVFGPYRVTKAFAPLIIESKGRITTTGSISGILSGTLFGPYSMSKHAIEAFTDSLAREMRKFDVHVSVIEPGNYNSAIIDTLRRRMVARGQSAEGSLYEDEMNRMLASMNSMEEQKEPDEVSSALLEFLSDANPKRRYMVVPEERQAEVTIRKILMETAQLNERQAYSYDRDELHAMLDEAITELEQAE